MLTNRIQSIVGAHRRVPRQHASSRALAPGCGSLGILFLRAGCVAVADSANTKGQCSVCSTPRAKIAQQGGSLQTIPRFKLKASWRRAQEGPQIEEAGPDQGDWPQSPARKEKRCDQETNAFTCTDVCICEPSLFIKCEPDNAVVCIHVWARGLAGMRMRVSSIACGQCADLLDLVSLPTRCLCQLPHPAKLVAGQEACRGQNLRAQEQEQE